MVKEYSLYLMDKSILGNGRMDYKMDKVHTLPLVLVQRELEFSMF